VHRVIGCTERPALELADIVQKHGEAFRQRHILRREQLAVLNAIERVAPPCSADISMFAAIVAPSSKPTILSQSTLPKVSGTVAGAVGGSANDSSAATHYFHVYSRSRHNEAFGSTQRESGLQLLLRRLARLCWSWSRSRVARATLGITCVLHT